MTRLRAGSSERDITPDESVPMAGGRPVERWSTGVHNPLSVTALVLEDGNETIGVVSADLIWVTHRLTDTIRTTVSSNVPLDTLIVGASHTHSGPYLPSAQFEEANHFHPPELGYTSENVASAYANVREKAAAAAIIEAYESRSPATLQLGSVRNARTQFNRRADGGLLGEVDIADCEADPQGDTDPELVALHVEMADRAVVLYNYMLHTTTMGGTEFSADWSRIVSERLQDELEGTVHVLFLNGAAGEIVPRNSYDWDEHYDSPGEFSHAIGTEVADTVGEALDDTRVLEAPVLETGGIEAELPLRSIDPEDHECRRAELTDQIEREGLEAENPLFGPPPIRGRFYIDHQLALNEQKIETVPVSLQYGEIGAAGLVTGPGEPLVQHGIDFKSRASGDPLLVAGYANGMLGYLPTEEAFEYGGYEVETSLLDRTEIRALQDVVFSLIE